MIITNCFLSPLVFQTITERDGTSLDPVVHKESYQTADVVNISAPSLWWRRLKISAR